MFRVAALYAGRPRETAADNWVASLPCPEFCETVSVDRLDLDAVLASGAKAVFSALPASVARTVEMELAVAGVAVFSNASAHRMDPDVPILIPEVNAPHLDACPRDRGLLVTNSNCSASGLVLVLSALLPLGIRSVHVATYQSVSGAGYPGVPSIDILGNVIPHIGGEDGKIVQETRKMLGSFGDGRFVDHPMSVMACAARVPTAFGHLETAFVEVENPVAEAEVAGLLREYRGHELARGLPSTPEAPIHVFEDPRRPQPKKDALRGNGMVVSVGGLQCSGTTIALRLLVNNVIRGAAGGSVQNAELAVAGERLG